MKNLRLVLVLIFVGVLSFVSNAQVASVGLRAGVNFANMANKNSEFEGIKGLNIAIPVEIGVNEVFSVQPELHFIQKGAAANFLFGIVAISTDYLEVPILGKANFGNESFKVYAVAGPSIGFAINRSRVTTISNTTTTEKVEFDNQGEETDNRLEIGAVIGVGTQIGVGPGAFVIDVRYNYDLNDYNSFSNGSRPSNWNSTKNRGIALTAGYVISF
jgi:hypothetical protein